ncbi:NAD(P)-dependent dehydrogenase (short-subunit alcohol dehydrogenase family) [Pacificibacter maritimus]|uniref:NAD(P)-dependent dehydrogenase (Short-subunit alcohol dehydrogenase family) n=1 Tax=Pacificibacter maritimus TaxID=762213 RepID=A0A3N4UGC9_9RHOB|nr:SDR family oxidoreductase [Pacificibacter maritimus]RPE66291.1 NAD(P)-dependent dehydrogenase (short-subunit alcohol dehydrogenase family) [Pacificibacter maritimus]
MGDQKALVTGAGKRIGRAIALYLGQRGYDVAVHYASSHDEAESVVGELRSLGVNACALQADLLVEAETTSLIDRAANALGGPLTLLVNNASIFENDTFDTATRDSWDRHIESNLRAPVVLTQFFAAQLPKGATDAAGEPISTGLVVNMIDQRVRNLTADFLSYTVAKMGLWAFTQTSAMALAPHIRVNAIGPGPTLQGAHQSPEDFAAERAGTLLGRGADPADITAALGYFIDAVSVTGQLLCTDGGQHLS